MGRSKKFKYNVLMAYKNGDYTVNEIYKKYGISKQSIKKWDKQISTIWKRRFETFHTSAEPIVPLTTFPLL
ncbi:transposase [Fictibacillus enclensis]|uniref:transposase n=1 Tax=Fictibacillus enclensis TaxID=1017270 RepID=UPI003337554A